MRSRSTSIQFCPSAVTLARKRRHVSSGNRGDARTLNSSRPFVESLMPRIVAGRALRALLRAGVGLRLSGTENGICGLEDPGGGLFRNRLAARVPVLDVAASVSQARK